ncbi:hypothetical protein [Wolbachia endosymbiont (group A) of Clivina fossor]|uniref:hypothetical protein n=1 Tax=Wolbachia endosymbiont (group A) of Clivina fossor TaxID=3066133 RepID=UPI003132B220
MKNSYQGIDSTIVKHVRFQASRLKSKSCFINESLEDIEQELFCQVWQYLIPNFVIGKTNRIYDKFT